MTFFKNVHIRSDMCQFQRTDAKNLRPTLFRKYIKNMTVQMEVYGKCFHCKILPAFLIIQKKMYNCVFNTEMLPNEIKTRPSTITHQNQDNANQNHKTGKMYILQ